MIFFIYVDFFSVLIIILVYEKILCLKNSRYQSMQMHDKRYASEFKLLKFLPLKVVCAGGMKIKLVIL